MAVIYGYDELNSFMLKFMNLWASGSNATLTIETHAGEACASLRVGLGQHPVKEKKRPFEVKKKVSPSRQRRRARRAGLSTDGSTAQVLGNNLSDDTNISNIEQNSGAEKAEEVINVNAEVSSEHSEVTQVGTSFSYSKVVAASHGIVAEKVADDMDVYTFNYWNDLNGNIVEAIRYLEEKLRGSFCSLNIKERDRWFAVKEAKVMNDGDLHVKVLLKKKMRSVALGVQTTYMKDKSAEISYVGVNL